MARFLDVEDMIRKQRQMMNEEDPEGAMTQQQAPMMSQPDNGPRSWNPAGNMWGMGKRPMGMGANPLGAIDDFYGDQPSPQMDYGQLIEMLKRMFGGGGR